MQHNKSLKLSTLALGCGATLMILNQPARASGFAVPELNPTGLALSNALVANPFSLGAIAYNPAVMSFHEGSSLSAGLVLVKPDLSVDTGSGFVDSDANNTVAIPAISAHYTVNETWALGISVSAPFGLETDWPAGTFDSQYPALSTIPTESKLEVVNFSPNAAYKINENLSVAAGIDYYWMKKVVFNGDINAGVPGSNPEANLKGDGRGTGYNLGVLFRQGDWSFGGNYHSSSNIPIDGEVALPAGTLPTFMSNKVHARLEIPSRLQLGVRNQTTEKLAIEFDLTRTGWSSFNKLVVDQDQYGTNVVTSHNEWDNANAYRLGATYDFTPETQLRVGYTLDETPQGKKYFSPRIPDADRQLFSFGIGHTLGNGWTLDAGYMYVKFDKRTIESSTPAVPGVGNETNGTTAVDGTYDSKVHLFAFGVTRHFK